MKPAVARACIEVGAEIINDVAGLRDPGMAEVVRETGAACIVMHMQGTPPTMQLDPQYTQVVAEVGEFFEERMSTLKQLGIPVERICLDPGIGFGKKSAHNWQLLAGLSEYQRLGRPVCLGVSRKGFLGKDRAPTERVPAGIAAALHGISKHAVHVIRTHDVRATRDAIDTWLAVEAAR
jgi:dihydropteroate synthase